jgi:inosose dehydratase
MGLFHSDLDRRRFLQAGALSVLGFVIESPFAFADAKDDPFGGFTLGVQSYTYRKFTIEQTLKHIHDLGLHHIEISRTGHFSKGMTPEQVAAVLKLCEEYDVTPLAFGVQHFSKDHDANRKVFELGKALGVRMFSADPDPDSFDSLDKLCDEYKIAIGIHPHGPQGKTLHRWYSADAILNAVKNHNTIIGSCLDTGHLIRAAQLGKKLDPAEEIRKMGPRNFGIHLKDHDNKKDTDVVFGEGVLDVPGVLQALRDVRFKGMISIEYEASADEPTADVKACIEVFKQSVKKLA